MQGSPLTFAFPSGRKESRRVAHCLIIDLVKWPRYDYCMELSASRYPTLLIFFALPRWHIPHMCPYPRVPTGADPKKHFDWVNPHRPGHIKEEGSSRVPIHLGRGTQPHRGREGDDEETTAHAQGPYRQPSIVIRFPNRDVYKSKKRIGNLQEEHNRKRYILWRWSARVTLQGWKANTIASAKAEGLSHRPPGPSYEGHGVISITHGDDDEGNNIYLPRV